MFGLCLLEGGSEPCFGWWWLVSASQGFVGWCLLSAPLIFGLGDSFVRCGSLLLVLFDSAV